MRSPGKARGKVLESAEPTWRKPLASMISSM
jgi:hypothetical protein